MVKKLGELFELAKTKEKKTISVAAAQDAAVLEAVTEAVSKGIVHAILVGDEEKIREIANKGNYCLEDVEIINEKDIKNTAAMAVKLVSDGKAQFIMKGMLGTSDLLKAVLNKEANLKREELLSHVMVYEADNYHKLIMLTDGGMVPYPELKERYT